MDIEQYLMSNGYYSEIEIRKAAGVDDRTASFLAIFGSFDDDGQDDGGALPEPFEAMLQEAKRRNAAKDAAEKQAGEQEARAIVAKPEPWSRDDWRRLVAFNYAVRDTDDGGEQGWPSTIYRMTERGERLLDPAYRAPGLYDDQAGIDG